MVQRAMESHSVTVSSSTGINTANNGLVGQGLSTDDASRRAVDFIISGDTRHSSILVTFYDADVITKCYYTLGVDQLRLKLFKLKG